VVLYLAVALAVPVFEYNTVQVLFAISVPLFNKGMEDDRKRDIFLKSAC